MSRKRVALAHLLVGVVGPLWLQADARASSYECKVVGDEWQRLSIHVLGSIEYVSVGPPDKPYELGTGLFLFGRPRGDRKNAVGTEKITAYGAGALFVRSKDGTSFKVCVTSDGFSPITIIKREF